MMNVRFETERLLIRDIETADLSSLLQVYSKKENMEYVSNGNYKWTFEQLSEKYNKLNKNYSSGFGIFVVEEKDSSEIIGEAGLFDSFGKQSKLELGYIIDSKHWGKGYGYEISLGLINYCFHKLKTKSVIARMYSKNVASVRLSEKCGMQKTNSGLTAANEEYLEYELSNPLSQNEKKRPHNKSKKQ
ncbi:MAG TPA: GNAT family N-acetyltransferase [Prolixibacteraceae bacterium]|nr:GNAT family N-acetyltransferase [Prolixibacteraceae bacterium]